MTKTLSGRAAFILAIGLLLGAAHPSFAGPADAPADNSAVTAPANPAETQAAPANQAAGTDQLSESDRTARPDDVRVPQIVTQQQQGEQPAARANPVVAGSQNGTWDETSLIGKIFIGFGALLTIASAARMFMA
jgi:hypothetical protein